MNRVAATVAGFDWLSLAGELDELGVALTPTILTPAQCQDTIELFGHDARFRSTIDMARYQFGRGQYRYFARPLPPLVAELRAEFWPHLLPIAREWTTRRPQLGGPWPDELDDWLQRCHDAGQTKPTPLLFRYGPGDWNALHRDLYGDLVFPLQVVVALDQPGVDFAGGEFLVVEQVPRAQSRGTAVSVPQGHGLVFTTRERPIRSARGWSGAPMRHGVSVVRSGHRHTLGLIFHDAR
jgi:hypothetical protein